MKISEDKKRVYDVRGGSVCVIPNGVVSILGLW